MELQKGETQATCVSTVWIAVRMAVHDRAIREYHYLRKKRCDQP